MAPYRADPRQHSVTSADAEEIEASQRAPLTEEEQTSGTHSGMLISQPQTSTPLTRKMVTFLTPTPAPSTAQPVVQIGTPVSVDELLEREKQKIIIERSKLWLWDTSLTNEELSSILTHYPKQSFDLKDNKSITALLPQALPELQHLFVETSPLQIHRLPDMINLISLTLNSCRLTTDHLREMLPPLATHAPNFTRLELRHNQIDAAGVEFVVTLPSEKSLSDLYLEDNPFGPELSVIVFANKQKPEVTYLVSLHTSTRLYWW